MIARLVAKICALSALAGCADRADPTPAIPAAKAAEPATSAPAPAATPVSVAPAANDKSNACPVAMIRIPGGPFKAGSDSPTAAPEEMPAFETDVASFCLEPTEVTVDAYAKCVSAGACTPAKTKARFCNARVDDRGDHPINCVDWYQADKYCSFIGGRLPTEIEWEYAARGGSEYRAYSWGNEPPDARTCWKHVGGSCKVRAFAAGAFGLYDMIGNVWEWTDDWFGDYPWPPEHGLAKIYRGGSWSRRFEKWMSPKLRNRYSPKASGSHLGLRCAATPSDVECPYGKTEDGKRCLYGVASATCPARQKWNGVRCALPGESECPAGRVKTPGHGCGLESEVKGPAPEVETTPISRVRSPEFDADCQQNKPGRPHAYRYTGGTHQGRNRESGASGCSNRDVGVGWNSTCCP